MIAVEKGRPVYENILTVRPMVQRCDIDLLTTAVLDEEDPNVRRFFLQRGLMEQLEFSFHDRARSNQGGKRPGGETGSPLLGQCVMRRRTGTSAPSALPVQLMAAKNLLSTNRK